MAKIIKTSVEPRAYVHNIMSMDTLEDINSFVDRCCIKKPGYLKVIVEMATLHLLHKEAHATEIVSQVALSKKKMIACQEENRQLRQLVRAQAEYIANAKN